MDSEDLREENLQKVPSPVLMFVETARTMKLRKDLNLVIRSPL